MNRTQARKRLADALEHRTTGGIVATYDDARIREVRTALAFVACPGLSIEAREDWRYVNSAIDWLIEAAVLARTCGEERMPADVGDLVRDLARIEYAQKTIDKVTDAMATDDVRLDRDLRRATVVRVERWLRDSRERRTAEIGARAEAKEKA